MYILLAIIAFLCLSGVLFLSEATMGVGILATGCLCGVLSRIVQADAHQKKLEKQLSQEVP
jgi:hypothetical protein